MGRPWTPREEVRLDRILAAGNSLAEAAARLVRGLSDVQTKARARGWLDEAAPALEAAPPVADASAEAAPVSNVVALRPSGGAASGRRHPERANAWTDADVRRLTEHRDAGRSVADAARALGRTENAVSAKAQQLWGGWRSVTFWTEEEDARLQALAREGSSAREIAEALGRGRADVIGRANRRFVGLRALQGGTVRSTPASSAVAREAMKKIRARQAGDAAPAPRKAPRRDLLAREPVPEGGVPLEAIRSDGCRWIYGDGTDETVMMCGQPVTEPGKSWCAAHHRRVYRGKTSMAAAVAEVAA